MQTCQTCKESKDILAFYNINSDDANFYSVCKECRAKGHKNPRHAEDTDFKFVYKPKFNKKQYSRRR